MRNGSRAKMAVPLLTGIHGVPENTHKTELSPRPIVNAINSPTCKLDGYVAKILQKNLNKNSTLFAFKIIAIKWKTTDIPVSFYVPVKDKPETIINN